MEEQPNIWRAGLNNGLIVGLALVIYSLLLFMTNLSDNKLLGYISYLILIIGIIWAHQNFKRSGNGYMTYGEGLGLGTIVSGIAGFISGVFSMLYIKFIDPNLMKAAIQEQIVALQDQGMSQAQIDQVQKALSFMQTPVMMVLAAAFSFIIMGFILSLIISAFTKKLNPEQFN